MTRPLNPSITDAERQHRSDVTFIRTTEAAMFKAGHRLYLGAKQDSIIITRRRGSMMLRVYTTEPTSTLDEPNDIWPPPSVDELNFNPTPVRDRRLASSISSIVSSFSAPPITPTPSTKLCSSGNLGQEIGDGANDESESSFQTPTVSTVHDASVTQSSETPSAGQAGSFFAPLPNEPDTPTRRRGRIVVEIPIRHVDRQYCASGDEPDTQAMHDQGPPQTHEFGLKDGLESSADVHDKLDDACLHEVIATHGNRISKPASRRRSKKGWVSQRWSRKTLKDRRRV